LHGALNAIEVSTPITGTDGTKIMRSWVLDYSVGRTREALAAAGGDHGNDAGREEIERFNTQIEEILNNSMRYSAMLQAGSGDASARQIRSYVLDNADSKTISDGDFSPTFERGEQF